MARKTAIDKLAEDIEKILNEYQDDVKGHISEIVTQTARNGAQAMRRASKQATETHTGDYYKGWTSQVYKERLGTSAVIYNNHPGLPHLLEYGHVTRNGTGRTFPPTPGREHIAPIADEITQTFVKEVQSKL